jgi:hypothetical protein
MKDNPISKSLLLDEVLVDSKGKDRLGLNLDFFLDLIISFLNEFDFLYFKLFAIIYKNINFDLKFEMKFSCINWY